MKKSFWFDTLLWVGVVLSTLAVLFAVIDTILYNCGRDCMFYWFVNH